MNKTGCLSLRRRSLLQAAALAGLFAVTAQPMNAFAEDDPLPSWNDGLIKISIIEFVQAVTDSTKPTFVPPEARIATFDQDGTLWVEHPMYSQVIYILDRVPAIVEAKPELRTSNPSRQCSPATARPLHVCPWRISRSLRQQP